ncbi:MAG: TraR/DksA family transcriptional regulator [Candidatus Omnitrophota bacterium]
MVKKKMLKKDLKYFKKIIAELRAKALEEVQQISEDSLKQSQREAAGDISTYTYHMADVATDTYDREFSMGLASNERKLLYEIEDALKRIDDSTFGICEGCQKAISKSRLKAVPYTRLCLKCQSIREKG